MRLGGEVYYRIGLRHQPLDQLLITDIPFHEDIPVIALKRLQILDIPRIRERIEIHYIVFGVLFQDVMDEIGAYEASPTGYQ